MRRLLILSALILWGLSLNCYAAPARKKVKVPCPVIIANPKTKEYGKRSSYVCYSTAVAAKKAGYVEAGTTANALPRIFRSSSRVLASIHSFWFSIG